MALLDWDSWLADGVDDADRRVLRERAVARVLELSPGPLAHGREVSSGLGLLVLDGWLCGHFSVEGRQGIDLVGPDDVFRPAVQLDAGLAVDACQWEVMTTVHAAVLDEAFARRIAAWPQVMAKVLDRLSIRLRWHGFLSALHQVPSTERRVHLALQAFADRWGRVTPQGILVPVPLTHRQLGLIIGACRTSTSSAVSSLIREGVLERRDDRTWILPLPTDREPHESGRTGPSG